MKNRPYLLAMYFLAFILINTAVIAKSIDCSSPYLGVDYVICNSDNLIELTDSLNEAFIEAKLRLTDDDKKVFIREQKNWIGQYGIKCGLPKNKRPDEQLINDSKICVKNEIESRTDEIRQKIASSGRDNGGFDCSRAYLSVDFVICSDEQLIKNVEYMGEIYWRGRTNIQKERRKSYVQEQRDWIAQYSESCNVSGIGKPDEQIVETSKDCVRRAISNRTDELKSTIASSLAEAPDSQVTEQSVNISSNSRSRPDRFDQAAQKLILNLVKCSVKKEWTNSFDEPWSKTLADMVFVAVVENRVQTTSEVIQNGTLNLIKKNLKENGHAEIADAISDAKMAMCVFTDVNIEALINP